MFLSWVVYHFIFGKLLLWSKKKKENIMYVDDDDKNWKENKIYLKNVNKMNFIRNDDYCIGIDKKKRDRTE